MGGLGNSLKGGATLALKGRQLYVREERRDGLTGAQASTLFGMQAPLGPQARVYSEYQLQRDGAGEHAMSVTGLEQGWKNPAGVAVQVAGEHGARSGESGEHTTVSGTLAYKGALPLSGSTRGEVRDLAGNADARQLLTATRLELALPSGFTMRGDMRLSTTKRNDIGTPGTTPLRFNEQSLGLSWRAPHSDAVQALGRWTRLADRRGPAPGDSLGTESVLGVAALEATVRLLPGVEWAAKGAARIEQDGRSGIPSAMAHSTLWASRLDYRMAQIARQPLRLGLEYRMLMQREAGDQKSGWLQEVSYDPNRYMRFGVGYNFSRFSGDPLVREQETTQGWFVRAQSRY
jgi:hypothetical protein